MANNELLILRGASGSGKSTYARTLVPDYVIVSRDLIRPSVSGIPGKQVLDSAREKIVTTLEDAQIRGALSKGLNVVLDNTNLDHNFAKRYAKIAVELNVPYRVQEFHELLEVLLERRDPQVPEAAVRKMYTRAQNMRVIDVPSPIRTPYVADYSLPKAILVDLDGTASILARGYSPHDPSHYLHDSPNPAVMAAVQHAHNAGVEIVFFTGREGTASGMYDTVRWLDRNVPFDNWVLRMRPEGDNRNDGIVKMEMFDKFVKDHFNVLYALDDRDRVVSAYRHRGIPVFQTNYGSF